MCGIVGMAGKLEHSHKAVFNNLLTVCQFRGRDATGVIRIKPDDSYEFVKRVGTPDILLDTKAYDRDIMTGPTKALIGHCRAKTMGQNTHKNAHPFDFDNVIGVHNGTLKGHYQHEGWRDIDVDSELLYHHIDMYGIEEALPTFDEDGAWALVFWDKRNQTLNFIRNKERPLWFSHSKNLDILIWASEAWMISAATRQIEEWDPEEGKPRRWELPTDTLYSFSIDHSKTGKEVLTMKQPKEIKGKEVRIYSGNVHGFHGGHHQSVHQRTTPGGAAGSANGGEVTSPFQRPGESPGARAGLDDNIDDLCRASAARARLLRLQEISRTADASRIIVASDGSAAISSMSTLGFPTDSKNIGSGRRPMLSLPSLRTKTSLLDSSGNTLNLSGGNTCFSKAKFDGKKVSLRTVAGLNFITDNKSGREFSEERFEQETDCVCCHCHSPVGDLAEVNDIFIHFNNTTKEEHISFLCTPCTKEPFA